MRPPSSVVVSRRQHRSRKRRFRKCVGNPLVHGLAGAQVDLRVLIVGLQTDRYQAVARTELEFAARRYLEVGSALALVPDLGVERGARRIHDRLCQRAKGIERMVECPVCLNPLDTRGRTERSASTWPCGHVVCVGCDTTMRRIGDHRCPTCRTPREGVTREQAEASASANYNRDLATQLAQQAFQNALDSPYRSEGMRRSSWQTNPAYRLFFPDQGIGNPFGAIDQAETLLTRDAAVAAALVASAREAQNGLHAGLVAGRHADLGLAFPREVLAGEDELGGVAAALLPPTQLSPRNAARYEELVQELVALRPELGASLTQLLARR